MEYPSENSVKDSNGVDIQLGDIILYGQDSYSAPKIGLVVKLYKKYFRMAIKTTNAIRETTCKLPEYSIVVNFLKNNEEAEKMFGLDQLIETYL